MSIKNLKSADETFTKRDIEAFGIFTGFFTGLLEKAMETEERIGCHVRETFAGIAEKAPEVANSLVAFVGATEERTTAAYVKVNEISADLLEALNARLLDSVDNLVTAVGPTLVQGFVAHSAADDQIRLIRAQAEVEVDKLRAEADLTNARARAWQAEGDVLAAKTPANGKESRI